MSEYFILYTAVGSLLGLVLSALLYALGGREGKWKRRFIASLILLITNNVAALLMGKWFWELLFTYPLLIGGFSLGYGADTTSQKVLRRTLYAVANVLAGFLYVYKYGGIAWGVFIPHIGIALWSIWLGVKNPIHASAEEVFICVLLNLGFCMYPFII